MNRLVACGLLGLAFFVGCAPDGPDGVAETPDEGWHVHAAEPEAGEDHPGSVLLTRRAEAGEGAFRPRLVLGCEEGVTELYVEWGTPLGLAEVPVAYRVGDAPEQTLVWTPSEDGEAAGLWGDSLSVPVIRSLLGHDRLTTRVAPEGSSPITSTFTLSGLDSLIAQVREACGWT